jgi:hypothetical protein
MGGACSKDERDKKCIQSSGRKNLKGRNHSEDRRRWEDNIKIDRREIWWEDLDWIKLA